MAVQVAPQPGGLQRGRRQTMTGTASHIPVPVQAKKRSHSLAPADAKPLANVAAPRGILKPRNTADTGSNDTVSMDITTIGSSVEYQTAIQDNDTRKSFGGRRVSFASHAHVRLFEVKDHTNSTGSPASSPQSSPAHSQPPDEDDDSSVEYPTANLPLSPRKSASFGQPKRRSSARLSGRPPLADGEEGEESMDLDDDDVPAQNDSTLLTDDDDIGDGDTMDMTGVLSARLSLPGQRMRRSSVAPRRSSIAAGSEDMDLTGELDDRRSSVAASEMDLTGVFGQGRISGGRRKSVAIVPASAGGAENAPATTPAPADQQSGEFTIPLEKALRPPRPPSDAFLALQRMANGDRDLDSELPASGSEDAFAHAQSEGFGDASFSSNASGESDAGEKTVNLTELMNRARASDAADLLSRASLGGEADMSLDAPSAPVTPAPAPALAPRPSIFQSISRAIFMPTPKPTAPAAPPTPTPAPAPPIVPVSQPAQDTPRRSPAKRPPPSAAFAPQYSTGTPKASPAKRPAPTPAPDASPTKKQAVGEMRRAVPAPAPANDATPQARKPVRRSSSFFRQAAPQLPPHPAAVSQRPSEPEAALSASDALHADPSPARPPAVASVLDSSPHGPDPLQWAAGVEPGDGDQEPAISIADFFAMTGVKFMDDFACPRYSTALGLTVQPAEEREYALDDYFAAMAVDYPQLEAYSWTMKCMQEWIAQNKAAYAASEAAVAADQPWLFREYALAPEEQRAVLLHQLKLIKAHTLGQARAEWYAWKSEWIGALNAKGDAALQALTRDEAMVADYAQELDDVEPALLAWRDNVVKQLTEERTVVEEALAGDQSHLADLRESIDEQQIEIDRQQAELAQQTAKLTRLEEKLEEQEQDRRETIAGITDAERQCALSKESTAEELGRLRDDLEAISALSGWRVLRRTAALVVLSYCDHFRVNIPCDRAGPRLLDIAIEREQHARREDDALLLPLGDYMLDVARRRVAAPAPNATIRTIVERLRGMWAAFPRMRREFELLAIKYPLMFEMRPGEGLAARATLLFRRTRAKAHVAFVFTEDVVVVWPRLVRDVHVAVNVAYGNIESDVVLAAVRERLAGARMEDHYGHLLEACLEAVARYE